MNLSKQKEINKHLYEFCEDIAAHIADEVSMDEGENFYSWSPQEVIFYIILNGTLNQYLEEDDDEGV